MKFTISCWLLAALFSNVSAASANPGAPPPSRPSYTPPSRPAPPPPRPAPAPAQQHPPQRFNLNNDLHGNVYHPPVMVRPPGVPSIVRPPQSIPKRIGVGPFIRYPNYNPNPWGWNHGIVWTPSPAYWGGGFWGPFAYGLGFTYFGAVAYSGESYDSYQVAVDSPGADLLEAYGLTQTPCGPADLVVIWGVDGSVICAFPNRLVAPGEYTVDPDTLSLVSVAPPPHT